MTRHPKISPTPRMAIRHPAPPAGARPDITGTRPWRRARLGAGPAGSWR